MRTVVPMVKILDDLKCSVDIVKLVYCLLSNSGPEIKLCLFPPKIAFGFKISST
jgi:hypothetical protein